MVARAETNWKPKMGGNEATETVTRRFLETAGGRQAFQIIVDTPDGLYEVGPFGAEGASIQFGSLDARNPFNGSFAALAARSLRPGNRPRQRPSDINDDQTIAGLMHPYVGSADYDGEIPLAATGTIYHIDGPAARIRIIIDELDLGSGGALACWIL